MFSTLPQTNFNFSVTFILSANAFNLDQSEILSFGIGLNETLSQWQLITIQQIVDSSKLKAYADNILNTFPNNLSFSQPWKEKPFESNVGIGENAGTQHFLSFSQ